ncbi:MAG: hypothetical protein ACXAAT_13355 [Candidatus Hodarchaeales archaeon]
MSEHIKMQRCNPCQVAVMPSEHGTTRIKIIESVSKILYFSENSN